MAYCIRRPQPEGTVSSNEAIMMLVEDVKTLFALQDRYRLEIEHLRTEIDTLRALVKEDRTSFRRELHSVNSRLRGRQS
jgi:hypothetical protein